jgi:hypothetical protein
MFRKNKKKILSVQKKMKKVPHVPAKKRNYLKHTTRNIIRKRYSTLKDQHSLTISPWAVHQKRKSNNFMQVARSHRRDAKSRFVLGVLLSS